MDEIDKIKILLVEDEAVIALFEKKQLEKIGYKVHHVSSGTDAINSALNDHHDLILMDIVLPNKSGVQATKEILDLAPHIKVIACSTLDQESLMMKAMEAGAVEFIRKPFDSREVVQIINRIFEKIPGVG